VFTPLCESHKYVMLSVNGIAQSRASEIALVYDWTQDFHYLYPPTLEGTNGMTKIIATSPPKYVLSR